MRSLLSDRRKKRFRKRTFISLTPVTRPFQTILDHTMTILDQIGPYQNITGTADWTIHDLTGPYRTIQYHMVPYGTLRELTVPYVILRDHTGQYRTLQDQTGPY